MTNADMYAFDKDFHVATFEVMGLTFILVRRERYPTVGNEKAVRHTLKLEVCVLDFSDYWHRWSAQPEFRLFESRRVQCMIISWKRGSLTFGHWDKVTWPAEHLKATREVVPHLGVRCGSTIGAWKTVPCSTWIREIKDTVRESRQERLFTGPAKLTSCGVLAEQVQLYRTLMTRIAATLKSQTASDCNRNSKNHCDSEHTLRRSDFAAISAGKGCSLEVAIANR